MNLKHLYDYRNMCAHPAMNESFELYTPNQETVIALIRNIMESILIKPPIFIKDVVSALTDDLAAKRVIYDHDFDHLKIYLDNKYYNRMTITMKLKTLKALWKFSFISEEPICEENRLINRTALEIIVSEIKDELIKDINENHQYYKVSDNNEIKKHFIVFLSCFPDIYKALDSDIQFQLKKHIENNRALSAIAWFLKDNIEEFYTELSEKKEISGEILDYMYNYAKTNGDISYFLDFSIRYLSESLNFNMADHRWNDAVKPYLKKYNTAQLIRLVDVINSNDQIYNRGSAVTNNSYLAYEIYDRVDSEYDFSKYKNFKYSNTILNRLSNKDYDDEDMDYVL